MEQVEAARTGAMDAVIVKRLEQIEQEHGVRILFAVESGSRAWGFASADSDYDVRFVYTRPARDYLRVVPLRDVIELPLAGALDINGWDLYKALTLFRKSNPPLLEWLHSPIIYEERGDFAARLRELARTYFSAKRMTYHYLSMVKTQFKVYIEGRPEVIAKKYLYALRPLLCVHWIEQNGTPPPTALQSVLDGIDLAADIRTQLSGLIERKQGGGELGLSPADAALNSFIAGESERLAEQVTTLPDAIFPEEALTALAWGELGV
jgi:predicted nucleotidyltransferase